MNATCLSSSVTLAAPMSGFASLIVATLLTSSSISGTCSFYSQVHLVLDSQIRTPFSPQMLPAYRIYACVCMPYHTCGMHSARKRLPRISRTPMTACTTLPSTDACPTLPDAYECLPPVSWRRRDTTRGGRRRRMGRLAGRRLRRLHL